MRDSQGSRQPFPLLSRTRREDVTEGLHQKSPSHQVHLLPADTSFVHALDKKGLGASSVTQHVLMSSSSPRTGMDLLYITSALALSS